MPRVDDDKNRLLNRICLKLDVTGHFIAIGRPEKATFGHRSAGRNSSNSICCEFQNLSIHSKEKLVKDDNPSA